MDQPTSTRNIAFLGDYVPRRCGIATFTTDHSAEREIIPTVARVVIDGLKEVK